ncbi:hypothetical protein D3C81_834230 [compost metagenome]
MAASALAPLAVGTVCGAFTVATTGGIATPLCGILVVGVSGLVGSKVGEKFGERTGEYIYGVSGD